MRPRVFVDHDIRITKMAKCSKSTPTEADTIMCLVDDLLSSYGILGCKRHADYKAIHGRVERLLCARNEALKKTEGPYPRWAVYNGYVYRIDGPDRFVSFADRATIINGYQAPLNTCTQEIAISTFAQLRLKDRTVAWEGYRSVVYPYMGYDKTDQVWCWSLYNLTGGRLVITKFGSKFFDTETAACEDLAKVLLETVWVLPVTKKE